MLYFRPDDKLEKEARILGNNKILPLVVKRLNTNNLNNDIISNIIYESFKEYGIGFREMVHVDSCQLWMFVCKGITRQCYQIKYFNEHNIPCYWGDAYEMYEVSDTDDHKVYNKVIGLFYNDWMMEDIDEV